MRSRTFDAARQRARDGHERIPGTLVQGSLDPGNLLGVVWRLHHAWPDGELIVIDDVGHHAGAPDMADALVRATDRYAGREPAQT